MEIEKRKKGNVLIVKLLEKRLDEDLSRDFNAKMAGFINQGNEQIVLDLSVVEFIDSSGLGSIISALKMLDQKGDFVLCGMREAVLSLFRLTRMDKVFKIFSGEKEAVTALSQ